MTIGQEKHVHQYKKAIMPKSKGMKSYIEKVILLK